MTTIPLLTKYSLYTYSNDSHSCIERSSDDADFGPVSKHCGDDFDLTLLFEQSILSIGPSVIFLLVFLFRSWYLFQGSTKKARRSTIWALKLITNIVLGAIQLVLVVLWSRHPSVQNGSSIAAAVLALADSLALCVLSNAEHTGTVKTSTVINVYLFFSTIFDAVQCRTLWLLQGSQPLAMVFSIMVSVKVMLLLLEAQGKDSFLMSSFKKLPPEATSGVFNRTSFWWLNPLLIRGFRSTIMLDDLFAMSPEFSGDILGSRMEHIWSKCNIHPLFTNPGNRNNAIGYALIASTGLIYIGLGLCTGAYRHHTYRAITMVRGSLMAIIFRKTLALDSSDSSDNSASVTLMSTDIDGIASAFDTIHDIWACPIEIALGLWLLEKHVGVACMAPALTALGFYSLFMNLYLSRFMGRGRREWNQAVQKRVTTTSSVLSLMKEIKMLGLTKVMSSRIQNLRIDELDLSKKFRIMTAWTSSLSHATPITAPILTFGLYAILQRTAIGDTLDVGAVFSSLSLISLLTEPASNLFHAIPDFSSCLGCFERIQEFLLSQGREDFLPPMLRETEIATVPDETSSDQSSGTSRIALSTIQKDCNINSGDVLVDFQNASFGVKNEGTPIVSGVNLQIYRSTLTAITGKNGCGKSTLLKGILGEIPCTHGVVWRHFPSVAYCDQSPWLRNTTIRQNIIDGSSFLFDKKRYDSVIEACALRRDLSQLPEGDQTIVGSNGVTLSGGQKQRVTLARALYSSRQLMVLDDIFSGLDPATADHIFDKVLGPGGLKEIFGITVVLVTQNTVWLDWWVRDAQAHSNKSGFYFGIYAMFGVTSLILVFLTVRFSQDMSLVDMALPPAAFLSLLGLLSCLGGAVMVIFGAKYLAATIPIAISILYCLQKFYLRTSRQLRFLDLEAKSPLYTHFLETLNGLATIRAFGWESTFQDLHIELLAKSQRPYYLLYCIQRWLNLALDLFVGALAVLLLTFAVTLSDITSPGALGVAMVNLLNFNQDLASLIESWTKMETSLGAIARLKDLEKDVSEGHSFGAVLHQPDSPAQWSFRRSLQFKQVSASYGTNKQPVLCNVSLRIEHGKITALCGRTGSPGNFMDQNDPLPDEVMISALKEMGLWNHIQETGGLDIDESTLSLSAGQQQRFNFARALVQKHRVETCFSAHDHGGIIALDEANSNADMETSLLMQRLLKEEFIRCGWTVIIVTHRQETIRFADEVVILDAGRVVDSDGFPVNRGK
ncbi:P-loop containing nucleoside triphosphate hydrolase protein [Aspergillus coremiiformis]|uniref:P-loop containing nucleoside triphosphate hydrolase protein n=1 Tax=Aspergillus coremiiformis TaxID=138285 RepID=A0A5N6Z096_9EURO|nr:P-loop containing nucleoside triphosphate hydrolase protein [Aspergillus coremiiformis]